jgi:hypothetical protein
MRTRVLASTLACVALSLGLGAAAAEAGVRIVAPANDAIKTKAKVRVALAVSGARSLRVSLDNSDITRRLARHGRLREAVLRGRLVEPGAHWLLVRWRPREGRAERTIERRFLVARRFRSLAGKLFPGRSVHSASGVLRLRLAVRRGVGLMRARVNGRRVGVPHIGRLWPTTALTLGARHGLRFGRNRVSVLAHDFTKARYDRETWTVVMRRSRPLAAGIAKHRAKAGGRAVRLDGRGARPTRAGRRLRWSWRIVRKPRGSRARLVGKHWPRPRLRPDVPGRYRLAVTVSEHSRKRQGARAAQTGPETVYPVTVMADANTWPLGAALEIDLGGYTRDGAIVVDEAPAAGLPDTDCLSGSPAPDPSQSHPARRCVYPMPAPSDSGVFQQYVLVLHAQTLAPMRFTPLSPQWEACPSTDAIRSALGPWTSPDDKVIAILVSNTQCGGEGGDPWAPIAQSRWPSAYVFTPTSTRDLGIRSGWYSEATSDDPVPAEISGFFQKSWPVGTAEADGPAQEYRFVPGNYVQFDTSKSNVTAGQNTMVVAGNEYSSQLTGDAAHGFQVLVLDKTLKPMLNTPAVFPNGAAVGDMARLLGQARTTRGVSTVFVQSIGTPTPPAGSEEAWNAAAVQLGNLGGTVDVFLSLGDGGGARPKDATGWYSLVAAPDPACPASYPLYRPCGSAIEASTPLTQKSGDLSGVLGRNQTWQYTPLIDEAGGDEHIGELLTLAYRPPSKWPFSGDPEARRVLDWLTQYNGGATDLRPLGNGDCYDPGKLRDVRSSYCDMELTWSLYANRLGDSSTGGLCAQYDKVKGEAELVGVDADTYKRVCDQVSREIGQLADVKEDMKDLADHIFAGSAGSALNAYLTVQSLSDTVKSSVEAGPAKANHLTTAEGLELAAQLVELYSVFLTPLEPLSTAGEFFGGALALAGEITSLAEGDEQGESALGEPVTLDPAKLGLEMENRLSAAGAAFGHAWDMLISDPEKLNTAHENFTLDPTNPNNDPECKQPGKICGIWLGMARELGGEASQAAMQNGVRHWAAGKFMAATYDVWLVDTTQIAGPQARDVTPADLHTIGCDRVYNFGNHQTWPPFYEGTGDDPPKIVNVLPELAAYYYRDRLGLTQPRTPDPVPRHGSNLWVLGQGNIATKGGPRYWPPKPLLDELYARPNDKSVGGGYGWERPWLYTRGQRFTFQQGQFSSCYWFAQDRWPYLP